MPNGKVGLSVAVALGLAGCSGASTGQPWWPTYETVPPGTTSSQAIVAGALVRQGDCLLLDSDEGRIVLALPVEGSVADERGVRLGAASVAYGQSRGWFPDGFVVADASGMHLRRLPSGADVHVRHRTAPGPDLLGRAERHAVTRRKPP